MNFKETYALIGRTLSHSFSQKYFTEKFENKGIDAQYINVEGEHLDEIVNELKNISTLRGFNVTIPYKAAVLPFVQDLDWGIKDLGAINTVKVCGDGSWKGYNTDVIGFEKSIREVTDLDRHEHAIILGSGGASKAVQLAFQKYRVPYTIISRQPDEQLFEKGYDFLTKEILESSTLIVNTTPLGMYPDIEKCPDIDYSSLGSDHVCFDLIYNPSETAFLHKAKAQNALVVNGYKMLIYQAEAAWQIWQDDEEFQK